MAGDDSSRDQRFHKVQNRRGSSIKKSTELICISFVLLGFVQGCFCTGTLEVHFLQYQGHCHEDWNSNKCDPNFEFCLSRVQSGDVSVSSSACQYGVTGGGSGHYDNTHTVNMESTTSIHGIPNPWSVKTGKFYDPQSNGLDVKLMLVTRVEDHDRWTSNDQINQWGETLTLRVWPSKNDASWEVRRSANGVDSLDFKIRLYCDANYYGQTCEVYCGPSDHSNGHFTCDSDGKKICHDGWEGADCDRDIDECKSDPCTYAGTCTNTDGSFYCDCIPPHTGPTCEDHPCLESPCQNGGVCYAHANSETWCDCTEVWTGPNCTQLADPCLSNPCLNGGACTSIYSDHSSAYHCHCDYPYTGPECDTISTTSTTTTTTTTPTTTTTTTTPTTTSTTPTTTTTTTTPTTTTTSKPTTTTTTKTELETTEATDSDTTTAEDTTIAAMGVADRSEQKVSSGGSTLNPWILGVIGGMLFLLALVFLLAYLLMKRRRKQKMLLESGLVVAYDRDNLAFMNEVYHNPAAIPPVPVSSINNNNHCDSKDNLRVLPPVPAPTKLNMEAEYAIPRQNAPPVKDESEEGAVGGMKPVILGELDIDKKGKVDPDTKVKVSETLRRHKKGRAKNDYTDFRSLSMSRDLGSDEFPDMDDEDGRRNSTTDPYENLDDVAATLGDFDDTDSDLTDLDDDDDNNVGLGEPHYNTLDEMRAAVQARQAEGNEDGTTTSHFPQEGVSNGGFVFDKEHQPSDKQHVATTGMSALNPTYDIPISSKTTCPDDMVPPVRIRRDQSEQDNDENKSDA